MIDSGIKSIHTIIQEVDFYKSKIARIAKLLSSEIESICDRSTETFQDELNSTQKQKLATVQLKKEISQLQDQFNVNLREFFVNLESLELSLVLLFKHLKYYSAKERGAEFEKMVSDTKSQFEFVTRFSFDFGEKGEFLKTLIKESFKVLSTS